MLIALFMYGLNMRVILKRLNNYQHVVQEKSQLLGELA
jgi:hypothetical protein